MPQAWEQNVLQYHKLRLLAPITLSGKKYVLNKQVSKYVVMPFFSNNTSILSFVLTGYGFMLPCMRFVHLALLDHSTPDCATRWIATYKVMISSSCKNCALALSPHFDIDCRITIFAFKLLANYEGNYECHD